MCETILFFEVGEVTAMSMPYFACIAFSEMTRVFQQRFCSRTSGIHPCIRRALKLKTAGPFLGGQLLVPP